MAMPIPVQSSIQVVGVEMPDTATKATSSKIIKQFGPARDAAGQEIPAPTVCGLDLVALNRKFYEFMSKELAAANVDEAALQAECEAIDKGKVPGHKAGKVAYSTKDILLKLLRDNRRNAPRNSVSKVTQLEAKNNALELKLQKLLEEIQKKGISLDVSSL